MYNIPFQTIDWNLHQKTRHKGESGSATWQTVILDGMRIRLVEYSPNYKADHWCTKGHIVHCLEGEFISEDPDGNATALRAGMMYVVSDNLSTHRSFSASGAKLLIIDGDFLNAGTKAPVNPAG